MLHHLTSIGAGSVGVVALLASLGLVAPEQAPPHVLLDLRPDAEAVRDASKQPNIIFMPLTVPDPDMTPDVRPTSSVTRSQPTDRIERVFRSTDTETPSGSLTPNAAPADGLPGFLDPPETVDAPDIVVDPVIEAELAPADSTPTGAIPSVSSERSGLRRGLDEPVEPQPPDPEPIDRLATAPPDAASAETAPQRNRFQDYFPDPALEPMPDKPAALIDPPTVRTIEPAPQSLPEAVQRPAVVPEVQSAPDRPSESAPEQSETATAPEEAVAAEPQSGRKYPPGAAGCTKYKTYNPETQTYRGFDGLIHSCKPQ